jgi:hypothetical protein
MSRVQRFAVLAIIILFVVLPLYELADIGEHWPHDGDIVQVVLFVLFIVGISFLCRRVACACLAAARLRWLTHVAAPVHRAPRCTAAAPRKPGLFLIFCDFRI